MKIKPLLLTLELDEKFIVTAHRYMTNEELRERCTAMELDPSLAEWIIEEYKRHRSCDEDYDYDDGQPSTYGRISLGMSWECVWRDLAEFLGVDEDAEEVIRPVYEAFFEE